MVSLLVAGLPLLGFSSYVPESFGYWCSVEWEVVSLGGRYYIVFIFLLTYFIPILLMTFSYAQVIATIREVRAHALIISYVIGLCGQEIIR